MRNTTQGHIYWWQFFSLTYFASCRFASQPISTGFLFTLASDAGLKRMPAVVIARWGREIIFHCHIRRFSSKVYPLELYSTLSVFSQLVSPTQMNGQSERIFSAAKPEKMLRWCCAEICCATREKIFGESRKSYKNRMSVFSSEYWKPFQCFVSQPSMFLSSCSLSMETQRFIIQKSSTISTMNFDIIAANN